MTDAFYASPLPGILLWAALYVSDFLFTMLCARMYKDGAANQVHFEGSYEITPYYQKEVDALRLVSPRFLVALAATCALQLALFFFALGAMVLIESTVHIRHLRNFFLFRAILANDGITGRIEYARPVMLRMSAVELFSFSAAYGVIYLMTGSWFVLGGVVSCLLVAINHRQLAQKHVPRTAET